MIDFEKAFAALSVEARYQDKTIHEQWYFYATRDHLLAIDAVHPNPKGEKFLWDGARWLPLERLKF